MKVEIDGKSLLLGVIIGWFVTVFKAALSVARDRITNKG